jgi:hypothetical protein
MGDFDLMADNPTKEKEAQIDCKPGGTLDCQG